MFQFLTTTVWYKPTSICVTAPSSPRAICKCHHIYAHDSSHGHWRIWSRHCKTADMVDGNTQLPLVRRPSNSVQSLFYSGSLPWHEHSHTTTTTTILDHNTTRQSVRLLEYRALVGLRNGSSSGCSMWMAFERMAWKEDSSRVDWHNTVVFRRSQWSRAQPRFALVLNLSSCEKIYWWVLEM